MLDALPERKPYTRKRNVLAPYDGYILKRWIDGCRNVTQIWKEKSTSKVTLARTAVSPASPGI